MLFDSLPITWAIINRAIFSWKILIKDWIHIIGIFLCFDDACINSSKYVCLAMKIFNFSAGPSMLGCRHSHFKHNLTYLENHLGTLSYAGTGLGLR